MVQVRPVWVFVLQGLVGVLMRVGASDRRRMRVRVVPVVVRVRVLVDQHLMAVAMPVLFRDVQVSGDAEQHRRDDDVGRAAELEPPPCKRSASTPPPASISRQAPTTRRPIGSR